MSDLYDDERVKIIVPKNVATFNAVRLTDDEAEESEPLVRQVAEQAGARVQGWVYTRRKGMAVPVLRIIGKNRKNYDLAFGDWLIVLGTNGSIRTCTDKQYRQDYKEIEE